MPTNATRIRRKTQRYIWFTSVSVMGGQIEKLKKVNQRFTLRRLKIAILTSNSLYFAVNCKIIKEKNRTKLAEQDFDPRNSGLWAPHASTAPLCFSCKTTQIEQLFKKRMSCVTTTVNCFSENFMRERRILFTIASKVLEIL